MMQVIYASQPFPDSWTSSIFLAGPTPRDNDVPSWRPEALRILEDMGYDGVVFIPEGEHGKWSLSYIDQVEWERKGLNFADAIVFWVPRELEKMPAFTTNVEFGTWVNSAKTVLGHPRRAPKTRYLDWLLKHASLGNETPSYNLQETLEKALDKIGEGATRSGGERYVPLHIWNTPQFRQWYENLKNAGNRLDEAEVRWVFRMPKLRKVFSWVLWVKIWIESENCYKENEWVFARTDTVSVALWHQPPETDPLSPIERLLATEIILVKEFRSPARTPDGFIHELPGGSSMKDDENPSQVASEEVYEETGLTIQASRFISLGSRQVAGTLSTHHAHLFAAELNANEMTQARILADSEATHGIEEDSERTYVEIWTVKDLITQGIMDWSNLGMIFKALIETKG